MEKGTLTRTYPPGDSDFRSRLHIDGIGRIVTRVDHEVESFAFDQGHCTFNAVSWALCNSQGMGAGKGTANAVVGRRIGTDARERAKTVMLKSKNARCLTMATNNTRFRLM